MNLLVVFVVVVLVVVFLLSFEQFGHELLLLFEQLRRHAKRVLRRSFELFAKIVVVVSIF
jgi:predicted PurR-regulated permease PerM